jgi:hypothetical protein
MAPMTASQTSAPVVPWSVATGLAFLRCAQVNVTLLREARDERDV